ncbi:N-formylglutamate amidohydrolase [Phaeovulum sp.]|uniref:N-formylglutamate amidohydrolase n=1 Tax=Phaeovulum sp. TaxID=2934796 RepID=UPI003561A34D
MNSVLGETFSALAEDDAIEVFNPKGRFPGLLVCDHASAHVPRRYDGLGLPPETLNLHIGVDVGIAAVTRALAAAIDAPAVLTRTSRLLIDCNRWIADPTSIPQESDGITVPGNCNLNGEARAERQERYFWPYHRMIHRMLAQKHADHAAPIFLAMHSCTRQLGQERRDIDAGTFWHSDARLSSALISELSREPGLQVAENLPYSGFVGTSFTLDYHTWGTGIPATGLEIVNDWVLTPPDQERWAERLAAALRKIVDSLPMQARAR